MLTMYNVKSMYVIGFWIHNVVALPVLLLLLLVLVLLVVVVILLLWLLLHCMLVLFIVLVKLLPSEIVHCKEMLYNEPSMHKYMSTSFIYTCFRVSMYLYWARLFLTSVIGWLSQLSNSPWFYLSTLWHGWWEVLY